MGDGGEFFLYVCVCVREREMGGGGMSAGTGDEGRVKSLRKGY